MDLYEYQGKELFNRVGIPVSEGRLATTPEEARKAAEEIGGPVVVKAQVLTGGRGKAGGVKLADDPADAEAKAKDILGLDINGHVVHKLWIEKASDIAKEYYLSVTFDRGAKKPFFMFTTQGGVEIEQVAEENPDALVRLHVDPLEGYQPWIARRLVYGGKVEDPSEQKQIAAIVEQLYAAFVEFDAMLCEINPLIVTPEGEVKALDSKFTVDDSALARHPDIAEWRDTSAADPIETFAREKHVTYVKLDGDVGVLANGAGLGMSTVDVVAHVGGRPANFCDLGGGGSAEGVVDALEVITRDPQVKSIFFNIFGGITRCDEVARGILEALDRLENDVSDRRPARRDERRGGPRDPRRGGARRTSIPRRRCSTERGARWSWRNDRALERARRGVPHERDARVGRRPRPRRRVVRAGRGVTVLDVATGGGHVARRLREAGAEVVTVDTAPGMQPDVIAPADHLPFADASFDVVACRIAAHHFPDALAALKEMARVARDRVVIEDNTFTSEGAEEADRSATRATFATTPSPSGAASSRPPGSRLPTRRRWCATPTSPTGSTAPRRRRTTASASPSCSKAASTTAASTFRP